VLKTESMIHSTMIAGFRKWWNRKRELRRVHGIRIVHDPLSATLSDSRGLWPFKKIVVNDHFFRLAPPEQAAFILHEVGHCKLFHLEKRVLALPLLFVRPSYLNRLCIEQEHEADAYAAAQGFGPYLVSAFSRMKMDGENLLHPDFKSRIERLRLAQGA